MTVVQDPSRILWTLGSAMKANTVTTGQVSMRVVRSMPSMQRTNSVNPLVAAVIFASARGSGPWHLLTAMRFAVAPPLHDVWLE